MTNTHFIKIGRLVIIIAVFLICRPTFVAADEEEGRTGTFYFLFDNDLIMDSDDDYSSGLALGWVSAAANSWDSVSGFGWVDPLARYMPMVNDADREHTVSIDFTQLIYTPEDMAINPPDPNDRPYAGVSYLAMGIHQIDGQHLDSWDLMIGIIGPSSMADKTQETIHDLIGSQSPQGWDSQIGNEILLNLSYEHRWRLLESPGWRTGLGTDFITGGGGMIGNYRTSAVADMTWRVGYRMHSGFGNSGIRPGSEGRLVPGTTEGWWGIGLSLAFVGEAVMHDVTIDGRLFGDDDIKINKEPLLGRVVGAIGGHIYHLLWSAQYVKATRSFKEENESSDYGRIVLLWAF